MVACGEPTKRGDFENLLRDHADMKSHLRITYTDGVPINGIATNAHDECLEFIVDESFHHITNDWDEIAEDYDNIASFEVLE